MDLKTVIKKRKSVRRYMDKKPDWRKIIRAIDAARFAPSAGGQFALKFILVSDENKIAELAAASQQNYVGTAKYVVVAVSDDSKLVRSYGKRGTRYASLQAGAALQNFWLALTELGLVTTWVGHFYDEQVRRTLNIPDGLKIEAMFPVGVEIKVKSNPKRKKKLDQILYYDKWKNTLMVPTMKFTKDAI